jgi:transposase
VVGVDVGITRLAVLSTGDLLDNPRHLSAAQARLRRLGRAPARKTGPDRRTRRRASHRWQRAADRLGRAHARVANLRRDGLHKLTTRLAREYGTVVVEDLNVAGMLANRRLARHVADRWYPSSKTCSGCGAAKAKPALSERAYHCQGCGLVLDRDRNAARNLAALAAQFDTAGSGPVAGRGADQKTRVRGQVAAKRQPGTAPAGQTGTVPPQGGTLDQKLATAS